MLLKFVEPHLKLVEAHNISAVNSYTNELRLNLSLQDIAYTGRFRFTLIILIIILQKTFICSIQHAYVHSLSLHITPLNYSYNTNVFIISPK